MNGPKINNILFLVVYVLSGALLLGIVSNNLNPLPSSGRPPSVAPVPEKTEGSEQQDMETSGLKLYEARHWKTVE
ncbi:MAG: hypothetical protein KBB26_00205 [Candidatus Omnitrophica bacterium]|nr:hypothetical protein [Candidatus Omnitrophota bacterium]HPB68953.1 hypothetical protein [Candidatus Omnitrophota bacterium]HQP12358.1 hypothetical protein [Candidatus Omnitrophota bacterium]